MTAPLVSGEFVAVADPEMRFAASGTPMARVRLVYNERTRDANGQWVDGPGQFISASCAGKVAENLVESIRKGDRIAISNATLQHSTWTAQDGSARSEHRLFVTANGSIGPSLRFDPVRTARAASDQSGAAAVAAGLGGVEVDPWSAAAESTQAAEPPF